MLLPLPPPLLLPLLLGVAPQLAAPHSKKILAPWPWQASIFLDTRYRCEGALISQEWVLTGANCFGSWPWSHFTVTLGPNRLSLDKSGNKSGVAELHMSLSPAGLALARLARPPSVSRSVWPVPLATGPKPLLSWKLCWAHAFKPDFDPQTPPQELHVVRMRPMPQDTCKAAFLSQLGCPHLSTSLPQGSQCTNPPKGPPELVVSDGSPLVCSQNNHLVLQGVMTWGPCLESGLPEIYTPVHILLPWIWDKVSNTTFDTSEEKGQWRWSRVSEGL